MKKFLIGILTLFILSNPVFAKGQEKLDVKSQSFMDLGRYIETLEINDSIEEKNTETIEKKTNEQFEEEAIIDVAKRYNKHTVELKLDDINSDALDDINNDRIFKLQVNETQYKIEQGIKTENMIWDGSKAFSHAFLSDRRNMAPIPSVVNSSKVSANINNTISADFGQTYLYNATGNSLLFIRANESTYNTGSVISYKGDSLNLSVGSFSSSFNHESSGGAILTSNAIHLPRNAGSFVLGGAYFANSMQLDNKTTGGGFLEYEYKRIKLNAQIGQSKYKNSSDLDTSLYLVPEFQISDSISLKTRFIRNVTRHTMQDELALTYKPKNSKRNLEFEINASNQYNETNMIKQRIKLSTSFRI